MALISITLLTEHRIDYFGGVKHALMQNNRYGVVLNRIWQEVSIKQSDIVIDKYIVMPNHLHAIITVSAKSVLSQFIGQFKSISTIELHRKGLTEFKWQAKFYCYQILDQTSYHALCQYIIDNPRKWSLDRFYVNNSLT